MNTTTRAAHAAILGGLLLGSACVADVEEGAEELMGEAESEIVIDDHDFMLLSDLQNANTTPTTNQIDALYGRATGVFLVPVTGGLALGCTGFLVDDAVAASARHCRLAADNQTFDQPATLQLRFGRYGTGAATNNFGNANLDALIRAIELGIPITAFTTGGVPFTSLTTWTCNVTQTTPNRDIEYFTCAPNVVTWTEPNGTTVNMSLLPGHIWGHFNTSWTGMADNQAVRNFGVNPRCGDAVRSIVTAPGKIEDVVDGCSGPWQHCFEHTADTISGHSGGPVMRRSDHVVYGVQNGTFVASWDDDETGDPCGSATGWHTENVASRIASDIDNITGSSPTGNAQSAGPYMGIGGRIGGGGGTVRTLNCPNDYLAAGIIGSTRAGYLGNMGLVCMPNRDFYGVSSTGNVNALRLDRAVVVAGGSRDTNFATTFGTDFNTYFNETLTDAGSSAPFQQALAMCPAGMFLRSISGFENSTYAGEVTEIECAAPFQSGVTTTRQPAGFGTRDASDGMTLDTTACSSAFAFINGLTIGSGWYTDSYRARCRRSF
jgi:V8-like Glu-specific endopeptidase